MAEFLNFIGLLLSILSVLCSCSSVTSSFNYSINGFAPAIATFYGPPTGAGSTGGACGYEDAVGKPPFSSMVSAGNQALYQQGKGCGSCYMVRCNSNPACSGKAVMVTITDQCAGGCDDSPIHFDMSGTALGALAKPGQGSELRDAGIVKIEYQRVPCNYGGQKILFHVDSGSNQFFLMFAVEFEGGDGDLSLVEIQPRGSKTFLPMQQNVGAVWKINAPGGLQLPISVRLTTLLSRKTLVAPNVIPANFKPGDSYLSTVNFN